LKQDKETADIPIIILSIIEDQEKGYRLGVDGYLNKPIDAERLITTVSSIVAGSNQHEESLRKKILVIEEHEETVHAIEQILQLKAYQVIAAKDSQEGIQKAQEESPDLIILDYNLTDDGGIVKTLRSMNETHDSQILVLTESLKADITTLLDHIEIDEKVHAQKNSG
jgi:DNA-binding response OmpR family regulator